MKPVSLLIVLLVLVGLTMHAQSTTTVEKNTKRITITSTKTDENGKPVTETWIAEGKQPEAILKNMAVNPEVMQKVDADQLSGANEGERLFIVRTAGNQTVVEGKLQDVDTDHIQVQDGNKDVIVISNSDANGNHEYTVPKWYEKYSDGDWRGYGEEQKSNCAALGIRVNITVDQTGCAINSLLDQGGAKEAGLTVGDVITKLDDYVITDFPSLYDALAHYLPGDDVTVIYEREGKSVKANVHLKSWTDLPGQEWRDRGDCGKVENFKEDVVKPKQEVVTPTGPVSVEPLNLNDARIYPNPTQGLFAFSFTSVPGPVTISITDVNGKVVYTEKNDNTLGYYNHDIDLKNAPSGNYVVSVKQGDKVFTQQLSKQ